MTPQERLVQNLIKHEGFRDTAYRDGTLPDGSPRYSIGYGTLGEKGGTITQEAAMQAMNDYVSKDLDYIRQFGQQHGYNFNDNQLVGLGDFTYNLGQGQLENLTKGGTRSHDEIIAAMPQYNKFQGEVLPQLTDRRNWAAGVYGGGGPTTPIATEVQPQQVAEVYPPAPVPEAPSQPVVAPRDTQGLVAAKSQPLFDHQGATQQNVQRALQLQNQFMPSMGGIQVGRS